MVPQPFCNSATDQNLQLFRIETTHQTGGCPGCSKMFGSRSVVGKEHQTSCIFLHLPGWGKRWFLWKVVDVFFDGLLIILCFFSVLKDFYDFGMSGNSAWIASMHSKFLNTAYMTLLKFAKQNQTRSTTNNRINGENHKKALFQLNLWWAFLDLILSSTNAGRVLPSTGAVKKVMLNMSSLVNCSVARYERWFKKRSKGVPPVSYMFRAFKPSEELRDVLM